MRKIAGKANRLLALMLVGILSTTSTVLAEKPIGGKSGKHPQQEMHEGKGVKGTGHSDSRQDDDPRGHTYFSARHRDVIQKYYGDQYRSGKCPPGLAKKNNGCMPPGQAKKWQIGRVLPRDVVYYELPQSVIIQLGIPPAGHRFVRVAADILMIAVGTGMVVDAIEDLGSL